MNISDDYLISSDIASEMNERQEVEALTKLLQYQFSKVKELGAPIGRYNGAKRVDITQLDKCRLVRSPKKFLTVIEQLERESSIKPSYGLEVKSGTKRDYIHFILELNDTNSVGIFFFDSKRMLSVPQIHNVERLIKNAGLTGAIIVANKIGIPAKQEAIRINSSQEDMDIITIEQYSSIEKRYNDIY
ncbi:MAG: hypothetical protein HeimC2_09790 [Candidatus Heimdallarchaeota archaeon LC_2]|nr:MAG: hypothetical protein HeimC2_09790 [Candidatus Heimdallarchaeota archaeon LC_2]